MSTMDEEEQNSGNNNVNWEETLKKEALGIDGLDLGEVHEVGDTFIVTQVGLINRKKYHLPKSSVESFDGETLRFKVNESDLNSFEQTEGHRFDGYSSFKSSDLSKELETVIPLIGQKLEVSKRIIDEEVTIIKEPVKEKKKVEIELVHEKVTIEKRMIQRDENNNQQINPSENIKSLYSGEQQQPSKQELDIKTEFTIPIKREEPVIVKSPYLKEEVIVKKKQIKETKTIREEIIHEDVNYDRNQIFGITKDNMQSV